jgi:flagellar hook-associated protein 3 FlgL
MSAISIGDLAQSFMLRHRNSALKQDMLRLTQELSTGRVADLREALQGNYSYLTQIERSLDVLGGYQVATTEAKIFASHIQTTLGRFQDVGEELANSLVVNGGSTVGATSGDTSAEARTAVDILVGILNTKAAGRSIFGGTATDRAATETSQVLLSEIKNAMTGATTPSDMFVAAQAWFDDPAGFAAAFYKGGASDLSPVRLSESEQVAFDIRATDPKLKNMLLFASVAAVADDATFGLTTAEKAEVFSQAGTSLLGARDSIISLRSRVGFMEAQIDGAATRNAAEITVSEYEKTALLQVDPYDAATRLEEVQFQLQSLYSVTVRMSQLSLANFL